MFLSFSDALQSGGKRSVFGNAYAARPQRMRLRKRSSVKTERKVETLGFINVDKPSGVTSSAIVNKIKRLTACRAGTWARWIPWQAAFCPWESATPRVCSIISSQKRRNTSRNLRSASRRIRSIRRGNFSSAGAFPKRRRSAPFCPISAGTFCRCRPSTAPKTSTGAGGTSLPARAWNSSLRPKRVRIDEVTLLGAGGGQGRRVLLQNSLRRGTYIRSLARDVAEKIGTRLPS